MRKKTVLLLIIVLAACYAATQVPPLAQDIRYHRFADSGQWLFLPNGRNVLSNLAFILAGFWGLARIDKLPRASTFFIWRFFYFSVIVVGLGSACYHLSPANNTLFWDRLPMTLGFAALTAGIISECLGQRCGRTVFGPLIITGILSVSYWWLTEKAGAGDLRPYILVQYLPIALVPLIMILFPKDRTTNRPYWILLAFYLLAKAFELQDEALFSLTGNIISGHTLKHLAAAAGIALFSLIRDSAPQELDGLKAVEHPCQHRGNPQQL